MCYSFRPHAQTSQTAYLDSSDTVQLDNNTLHRTTEKDFIQEDISFLWVYHFCSSDEPKALSLHKPGEHIRAAGVAHIYGNLLSKCNSSLKSCSLFIVMLTSVIMKIICNFITVIFDYWCVCH